MPLPVSHFHVLLSLAGEDRHGYSIMRETEAITDNRVKLGPGALYVALGKLCDAGLIEEIEERPAPELDDARRRYYRITGAGREALGGELERMRSAVDYAARGKLGLSPS